MKYYSIKTRLTAMYAAVIMILIGCTSLTVGLLSSRALMNKSINSAKRELILINDKLELFVAKLETESLYLTRIQGGSSSEDRYQQFLYTSGILSFLNDFILIQPSVESIAFYDSHGMVLYSDAKSNISAIPAVQPKFPSIWKGGCASNRFGYVERDNSVSTKRCAVSPSPNRAYRLISQAQLQPVWPPPFRIRSSSVRRTASVSSGVCRTVIASPG